jgi:propionyl-CoA carboxylase alpha chain
MADAAVLAGKTVGYVGAGTVEFLVEGDAFYFLEVNTRLQVEHPVTEAITGLDLVREQIRIAEGEHLGYSQKDLSITGHAIEARLCAENPARQFLPTPGRIDVWEPAAGDGARFDSGIESGSEIAIEFDPMIAKVIVHAPTRREAAARLARVLEATRLQGITHNRDFLVATLRSPAFLAGDTTTDFIARVAPTPMRVHSTDEHTMASVAAALHASLMRHTQSKVLGKVPAGWRNSKMPPQRVSYQLPGRESKTRFDVAYRAQRDGSVSVQVNGQDHMSRVYRCDAQGIELDLDSRRFRVSVTRVGDRCLLHGPFGDLELVELPRFARAGRAQFSGGLQAPMPGRVLSIAVREGQQVERGQLLLILEAMKMEHRITAPADGSVKSVKVSEGEQVANGAVLVMLEDKKD